MTPRRRDPLRAAVRRPRHRAVGATTSTHRPGPSRRGQALSPTRGAGSDAGPQSPPAKAAGSYQGCRSLGGRAAGSTPQTSRSTRRPSVTRTAAAHAAEGPRPEIVTAWPEKTGMQPAGTAKRIGNASAASQNASQRCCRRRRRNRCTGSPTVTWRKCHLQGSGPIQPDDEPPHLSLSWLRRAPGRGRR